MNIWHLIYPDWMPLVWLAAAILLGILEALTIQLVAIWFAAGAVAAIVPAFLGVSGWGQLFTCLIVSGVLLYFTRPLLMDKINRKVVRTNADRYVGKVGTVLADFDPQTGEGRIQVEGKDWAARSEDGTPLAKGEKVLIRQIVGVTMIVQRL